MSSDFLKSVECVPQMVIFDVAPLLPNTHLRPGRKTPFEWLARSTTVSRFLATKFSNAYESTTPAFPRNGARRNSLTKRTLHNTPDMTNRVAGCSPDTTPSREGSPSVPQNSLAEARKSPKSMFSPRMPPIFLIPHACRRACTRRALEYRKNPWQPWPTLLKLKRWKLAELVKLHRDGAINSKNDSDARLFATIVHIFGATYSRRVEP